MTWMLLSLWFCCLFILSEANRLLHFTTAEEYTNICMQGISHKGSPGPEADLFEKCRPWKDRSCCTKELSEKMHVNETWYKLNWNHCSQPLSDKCRGRFIKDLCFYECSPNVGPWLVAVDGMKIRSERFMHVPLCQSECNAWYDDCKSELTCIENWSRNFNWSSGTPQCPEGSQCRTIKDTFNNSARDFCEKVWDYSWKVVPDSDPAGCMVMWWNDGAENPNYRVALNKAKQITGGSSQIKQLTFPYYVTLIILMLAARSRFISEVNLL